MRELSNFIICCLCERKLGNSNISRDSCLFTGKEDEDNIVRRG